MACLWYDVRGSHNVYNKMEKVCNPIITKNIVKIDICTQYVYNTTDLPITREMNKHQIDAVSQMKILCCWTF